MTPAVVMVEVSCASAWQRFHGCDEDYIRQVCHGRCCTAPGRPGGAIVTITDAEQAGIEGLGGRVQAGRVGRQVARAGRAGGQQFGVRRGEQQDRGHQ